MIQVPFDALETETLDRVITHFILREGSDYGEQEVSFEQKLAQVHQQLQTGSAILVFDEDEQSVNIILQEQLP
ncbi:YheU family protein [Candidatus Venteria ishoeyi]|nr:YheU family protein [Candidatus Venteria ishoeyi]SEH06631.1 Uncharacterised protein [Candidatus Venteria ishoeyi]